MDLIQMARDPLQEVEPQNLPSESRVLGLGTSLLTKLGMVRNGVRPPGQRIPRVGGKVLEVELVGGRVARN